MAFFILACSACSAILGDFDVAPAPGLSGDAAPEADAAATPDSGVSGDTGPKADATAPSESGALGDSGPEADAMGTVAVDAARDAAAPAEGGSGDAAIEAPGAPSGVVAGPVPVVSTVTTLAGSTQGFADGAGAAAKFSNPVGVAVDVAGNVYVADAANQRIRKVTPAGVVTTLAGSGTAAFADGTGAAASFSTPLWVAVDVAGNVYVADGANQRIRMVTAAGVVTTLAGSGTAAFADGTGAAASFSGPGGVAVDGSGNVYVADSTNQRIRIVTPAGAVTTVAGSGTGSFADGTGAAASFDYPSGIAVNAGNVWVADSANNRIRKIAPSGAVMTLAGSSAFNPFADGIGAAATFSSPQGVALDAADNAYVSDQNHHRIRIVTPAGVVTTLAGSGTAAFADGPASAAEFSNPSGVAVDAARNVYVGDTNNNRVRKITSTGIRQLAVTWTAPSTAGSSPITGYTATAAAAGYAPQTCTTAGPTSCTVGGLTSGVAYSVSVTATSAAGTSGASASAIATPN
jgi:fibronectin type III domain protein/NHL repeat-containing protein